LNSRTSWNREWSVPPIALTRNQQSNDPPQRRKSNVFSAS
jgi:hypothetical protein